MLGIEAGGEAQYDDQLECFYARLAGGAEVRVKTLDELAAAVRLTDAERADLAAMRAGAERPVFDAREVDRLRAEKAELEGQVATLRAVKAEMQEAIRADILTAVRDGLKG
ncbi:MAG: hypothetical protein K2X87_09180 [Gemmataceae bacterium]|nr:hypothetical protein [Gemmataceae bacterium]